MRDYLKTTLLTLLGICFLATGALAQGDLDELSETHRAMAVQLGETAVEWWNPRLNKYRRAIDAALSADDRTALNQMRVRFAILLERVSDDNGDEAFELMEIWMQTVEIAIRNKEGLASLQTKVFTDLVGFRGELASDVNGGLFLSNRDEITMVLNKVEGVEEEFASIYGFIVEPLIMLFNGGDLRDMFPGVMSQSATTGTESLVDLLPASNVLMQNYPNPANQSTTIPVNLKTAGTASLRVYSENGGLAKTVDLGTLPAGEGKVELGTADLESGTYLYQLVLDRSDGEELYAKVMQVVR